MEQQVDDNRNGQSNAMTMADFFITAMFLPKNYEQLLQQKKGRIVRYLLLLLLLVAVIQYAIPTLGAIAGMGGVKNIILSELPNFSLRNGVFSCSEKYEKKDEVNGMYILIDTSVREFTKADVPSDMVEAVLVSKRNILFYSEAAGLETVLQNIRFSELGDVLFNNLVLARYSTQIWLLLGGTFILCYLVRSVKYMFTALLYGVVMFFLLRMLMGERSFKEVYCIALFAQSIGALVVAVTTCIGSPLLILAGSIFDIFITISIMNKVMLNQKLQRDYL